MINHVRKDRHDQERQSNMGEKNGEVFRTIITKGYYGFNIEI